MLPNERFVNDFHSPHSVHHIQRPPMGPNAPPLVRGSSHPGPGHTTPQPFMQTTPCAGNDMQPSTRVIPRASSDVVIQEPRPMPAGQYIGRRDRVQWKLGSEG